MKKTLLVLSTIMSLSSTAFSQQVQETHIEKRIYSTSYLYAYVNVSKKTLSAKLKVDVDLGDTPEQLKAGEEYSGILTNKKSYAAILNYMSENGFELVQTLELTSSYHGSGGTDSIIFILKKPKL